MFGGLSGLVLFFEPFCDFLEEWVGAHVQDWDLHFFFGFDEWFEFGHEGETEEGPVDFAFFDECFGCEFRVYA